jgi:hypothetical protein
MHDARVEVGRGELAHRGLTHLTGTFATPEDAWRCAREFVDDDDGIESPIEVIGDFVVPPPNGPSSRDFQTLHFDFGLPLVPHSPADVARLTALHVPAEVPATTATTRFVPLRPLLNARRWPDADQLVSRFASYGESHGAWKPGTGYSEGSLARVIEAALDVAPALPSVRDHPGFLCGTEFATLADETHFFTQRGLPVDDVVVDVCLQPGELLLFDNLALAHGRRGSRGPGELHQRVFGHRAMSREEQVTLRDRVLADFRG